MAFVVIVLVWLAALVLGFALIMFGLRHEFRPVIHSFFDAIYCAGGSVLTLGAGDAVAVTITARCVVLAAATSGVIFLALQVSYLFSMQTMVQQREQMVNTLISRAGAPASGLVLLLRYKELNILPALYATFTQWESWIAGILESHRAYPMLLYFRSSNNTDSWLSVAGAMLDASSLMVSGIKNVSIGEAELFYWLACSTLKSICSYLKLPTTDEDTISPESFAEGLNLLRSAGYEIDDDNEHVWRIFKVRREGYMPYLCALCDQFDVQKQTWIHELAISQISVKDAVSDSVFLPQV